MGCVQAIRVIDPIQLEVVEILTLTGKKVLDLVRGILAVVTVVKNRGEELEKRTTHRCLVPPAAEVTDEGLHSSQVRRGEDQEASGLQHTEDLLKRVEWVPIEVLKELAEEDGVKGSCWDGKTVTLDIAAQNRYLAALTPLVEHRLGSSALDIVVQAGDLPPPGLGQRREVTGKRADIKKTAPVPLR